MIKTLDLNAMIEAALRAKPARGDEHYAHCSDTICDRQTWLRRHGEEPLAHDPRTLVKFELGNQFEEAIASLLGYPASQRNVEICWDPWRDSMTRPGIIGHADVVDFDHGFVLEIKSTSFLRGAIPTEASRWYIEQAVMYARALQLPRAAVLVGCRESGKIAPAFWFNLADQCEWQEDVSYGDWAVARAKEIIASTDPAAPMPAAEPRTSWACKTCNYTQCEMNKR